MILSIGEILVDMIGEEKDGCFSYQRKAGGAPFNVSCAIKKFGGHSAFVGNVGNDIIGNFLINFANKQNLDELFIKQDKKHNTTLAFVDIDDTGERNFCFYRKNTADYHLPKITNKLLMKANIIHIGSLMISEKNGFIYACNLIEKAKKLNKLISFDVNYRTDIFSNKEEAISRYKMILEQADIIKLSEDEVEVFSQEYVNNLAKDKLVCISLGGKGSKYIFKDITNNISSIRVSPIDTTGAGDAFYAGVLSNLDNYSKKEWNKELLDKAFRFGNICGALNTLGKGAIDNLPTLEEIKKYL